MDKFLEIYHMLKLNQEESENLNRQITISEIEVVTKKLPINKSPEPNCFIDKFYQTFRKELTPTFQTNPKNPRGRNTPKVILQG